MKTKGKKESVYIVGVFEDSDASCTHTTLFATTHPEKARRRLHKEIRAYINSWHGGNNEERMSKKDYFRKGFIRTGETGPGKPRLLETWVLDEDGTYVEFSLTKAPLDTTDTGKETDLKATTLFVITVSDVYQGEDGQVSPIVRTTRKEARKELARLKASAKETYRDTYDGFDSIPDGFSFYKEGYWSLYHYDARINAVKIPTTKEATGPAQA